MDVRLAQSLDLTRRERNELVLAAGFAPAFPESSLDDAAPRPIRVALDTVLDGHLPFPAMVVPPHGILVTANRAFELFHEDVAPALLAPPVNVFRLALHPGRLAARVRNLMPRPSDMRYRWVCVRLDALDVEELRELLIDAWRMCVPKKVAAAYEG